MFLNIITKKFFLIYLAFLSFTCLIAGEDKDLPSKLKRLGLSYPRHIDEQILQYDLSDENIEKMGMQYSAAKDAEKKISMILPLRFTGT